MAAISVYDPPMCCSTGICGTQVDQNRIDDPSGIDFAIAARCESFMKYHIKKGQEVGLTDAEMREAVAVGRMVKEASVRNILARADRQIPDVVMSSGCCRMSDSKPAAKGGCCGSASGPAAETEKGGGCC